MASPSGSAASEEPAEPAEPGYISHLCLGYFGEMRKCWGTLTLAEAPAPALLFSFTSQQ